MEFLPPEFSPLASELPIVGNDPAYSKSLDSGMSLSSRHLYLVPRRLLTMVRRQRGDCICSTRRLLLLARPTTMMAEITAIRADLFHWRQFVEHGSGVRRRISSVLQIYAYFLTCQPPIVAASTIHTLVFRKGTFFTTLVACK